MPLFGRAIRLPTRCGRANAVDWLVVNMVDVGEETGDLDKMLMKVADNFDEKADVQITALMNLLEPVMIVFLGLIVGTIVMAMFLPILIILTGPATGGTF